MAVWIVSYDLRAPGRNYNALYDQLKSVPYAHVLESFWLIEADGPSARIRDALKAHMDANDGIAVIEFTQNADWAFSGVNQASLDWVKKKRP